MTMAEYIKREAALSAVDCGNLHKGIVDALQENIKDIPAADVVEVRHAYWIRHEYVREVKCIYTQAVFRYECSDCHDDADRKSPYCPNCGAKMDGGVIG